MTHETPSPPRDRRAEDPPFSDNGPTMDAFSATHADRSRSRELSPWSARRALTQKLNQHHSTPAQPQPDKDGGPPWSARKAAEMRQNGDLRPPPRGGRRRDGSTSPPPQRKPTDLSHEARGESAKDSRAKSNPSDAGNAARRRDASPEPYRKPRERSKERKKDRHRDRDGSTDRRRDGSTERRRHRSRDGKRDRSRDGRDRSKESREGKRHRSRDRYRDRDRERERDRHRDRDRDRHRDRDGRRERRDHSADRRSRSPLPYRSLKRPSPSASPPPKRRRRSPSDSRSPPPRNRKPLPSQEISFRGLDDSAQPPSKYGGAPRNLEKPNFKTTGLLAKAANKVEGTKISLKYHEPAEARKPPPSARWRMFVFDGDDVVDTIELHTKSSWLLGRSIEVVDYVLEHPSSSGQHAVIQFRYIQKTVEDEFGVKKQTGKVKPYVIDLESSNGTELNGRPIETSRYLELRDKDILKFAGSEREYVLMLPAPEK